MIRSRDAPFFLPKNKKYRTVIEMGLGKDDIGRFRDPYNEKQLLVTVYVGDIGLERKMKYDTALLVDKSDIVLEKYETEELAKQGHEKWLMKYLTSKLDKLIEAVKGIDKGEKTFSLIDLLTDKKPRMSVNKMIETLETMHPELKEKNYSIYPR